MKKVVPDSGGERHFPLPCRISSGPVGYPPRKKKKKNLDSQLTLYSKIIFSWIVTLKVIVKTIKILGK